MVAVYEVEARNTAGLPTQDIVAVYCVLPASVETGASPWRGIVTPETVELLITRMLDPLLPPLPITFGTVYAGSPVVQDKPVIVLKRAFGIQPAGKTATFVFAQDTPVVTLKPLVEVQPVGGVETFAQDAPVMTLKPLTEVQPSGKLFRLVILSAKARRDIGPNIPSGVKPFNFCQATTASLVLGPKFPSSERFRFTLWFNFSCKHFTSFPIEPCLSVVVIVQEEAEAVFDKAKTPRKTKKNTKTRPKIFFSILLIHILVNLISSRLLSLSLSLSLQFFI